MNLSEERFDILTSDVWDFNPYGGCIMCQDVVEFINKYENTTDPVEILTLLKEQLK